MTPGRGGRRGRAVTQKGLCRGRAQGRGAVGARAALERFHSEIEFHMTPIFYDIVSISYGIRFTQLKNGKFLPFILRTLPFALSCLANIVNICVRIWVLIEYAQARL